MEKTPPEAPRTPPLLEGQKPDSLLHGVWSGMRKVFSQLFPEDPEVAAILTTDFRKKFKKDFRQMLADRHPGASPLANFFRVESPKIKHETFDALVRDNYRLLENLTGLTHTKVMRRLMKDCNLPLAGQL